MTNWNFGVIGNGIEIQPSNIEGAGMGLFTSRCYAKNDLITEYVGTIITHDQALRLREQGKDTHIRALNSFHLCIDGIKQPQQGVGGASFANDARNPHRNNAVFVTRYDRNLACDRVFLKAKNALDAGTEVFVGYGRDYWCWHGREPVANSPAMQGQEARQQQQGNMDLEQPDDAMTSAQSSMAPILQRDDSQAMQDRGKAAAAASGARSDVLASAHCTPPHTARTSWQQEPQQLHAEPTEVGTSEQPRQLQQVLLARAAAGADAAGLQQAAASSDSSQMNSPARTESEQSASPEQQHHAADLPAGLVAFGRLSISREVSTGALQEGEAASGKAVPQQQQHHHHHQAASAQQAGAADIQPGTAAAGSAVEAAAAATTATKAAAAAAATPTAGLPVSHHQQAPHHAAAARCHHSRQQAGMGSMQKTRSSGSSKRSPSATGGVQRLHTDLPRQQLRSMQLKPGAAGISLRPTARHDDILQQHIRSSTAHLKQKQAVEVRAATEHWQQLTEDATLDAADACDDADADAEGHNGRDATWSPPGKPRKHTLQEYAAQQAARPQRRRRAPDPNLQYNGTQQAAKPIERWW